MTSVSTVTDTAPQTSSVTDEGEQKTPRFFSRFLKAGASSVVATGCSQVTLIVTLAMGLNATVASLLAFTAGAIPNWFLARQWAWGRKGKANFLREVLPYLCVIGFGALLSSGLTTIAAHITQPLEISGFVRIVVLDGAYLTSFAIVFLIKFFLLDRVVFGGGRLIPRRKRSEPAAAA